MESSKKKYKPNRRSQYGIRENTSTHNKSTRFSAADRVKYRYKPFEDNNDKTFHPDTLVLITTRTWNLFRVSHLCNVDYNKVKLKQYAARIKQELVKYIEDTTNSMSFSTKITLLPELEETDEGSNSLQIEVFVKKGDSESILKYKGVILSWGENSNIANNLTQLPVLLCVGAVNIIRIVHKTLTELFDTLLHPLRLAEDDLFWLSAMLSDYTEKGNYVTYNYITHSSTGKKPIVISFPCTLIQTLWNLIHPSDSEEISYKEVYDFHDSIQSQLTVNFGIEFKRLKLNKIVMRDATIACEGKIKIQSIDSAVKILSFINDVSLLLDKTCPEMSDEF